MRTRIRLLIGVILTVMLIVGVVPTSAQSGEEYVIHPGDTVFEIAIRFGTSIRAIVDANPGIDVDLIYAGDTLIIPSFRTNPAPVSNVNV